jgi:hypothetical protein
VGNFFKDKSALCVENEMIFYFFQVHLLGFFS